MGVCFLVPAVLLRYPANVLAEKRRRPSPTAATCSGRFICHRQRSLRSPKSNLRFDSVRHIKKADTLMGVCFFGAGNRNRTGTDY